MKILHITDVHVGWEADLGREKQAWERLYRETAAVAAGSGKADILAVTGGLGAEGVIIPDTKNQRESGNSPANAT